MIVSKKCFECGRTFHYRKCATCGGHIYSKKWTLLSCAIMFAFYLLGVLVGVFSK